MNRILDSFCYFLWRIFNPISFLKYIFSSNINLDRKKSYLGSDFGLEELSNKIKFELFNSDNFIKKVKEAEISTDNFGFTFDCFDYLSPNLKDEIYHFANNSTFVRKLANSFLGVDSTLNTISIYANVPRISDTEVGSKMWHRDGNTYLAADFMFAISEINDKNGPFFWIDPCDFGSAKYFESKSNNGWEFNGRFSDEELFISGLKADCIKKFTGAPGSYILLNTGESFHKGGFCKSEIRVLGRFVYSSFGYSFGNINKYKPNSLNKGLIFSILFKLYSTHEKVYRNLNKFLTKNTINNES